MSFFFLLGMQWDSAFTALTSDLWITTDCNRPLEHLCQHIHFIPGQKRSKVKNCFYIVLCFAVKQTRCAFVTCYSVTLFKDENILRLKITSALVYSAILRSWSDSPKFLSHVILNGWAVAFCSMFLNIHQSRVLTPLKMPLGDWLFFFL